MTVVAYRGGVMAADSGAFSGKTARGGARKVARAPDGALYGVCGVLSDCEEYLQWVREKGTGTPPLIRRTNSDDSDCAIYVLRVAFPVGGLIPDPQLVTAYGCEVLYGAPYAATGSAMEAALGAMHAGAGAVDAVRAAIAHNVHARGPVLCVSFGMDEEWWVG